MSNDALREFVGKLNTDADLQAALGERFGDLSEDIPAEELISFASSQGYEFTVDEAEVELADEALEGVAGGIDTIKVFPKVEIDLTASFEEIKVTYVPRTTSFNCLTLG